MSWERTRLRCTWVSTRVGMTILPVRSTRVTSAGTCTRAGPIWTKRPPRATMVAFSRSGRSSPKMTRAPT